MKRKRIAVLVAPVVVLLLSLSAPAWAQSSAAVSSAREIAKQGLDAFDAGHYQEASQKLLKAFGVVKVPTLAVYAARSLVKMGRLVEACELYLQARRLKPAPDWPDVQVKAQREAAEARAKLLPRLPRLTVMVDGAAAQDVTLTIDGVEVASALINAEQLVDPGTRRLVATVGEQEKTEEVTLREGERRAVTLTFMQSQGTVSAGTRARSSSEGARPPGSTAAKVPEDQDTAPLRRLLGWVGVGVGGAAIVLGTATGLMSMSKRNSLNATDGCVDDHCYPEQASDVDTVNRLRTVSTMGFIAGGVIGAAGVTLLLTSPRETGVTAALRVGAQSASLAGSF